MEVFVQLPLSLLEKDDCLSMSEGDSPSFTIHILVTASLVPVECPPINAPRYKLHSSFWSSNVFILAHSIPA